MFFYGYAVRELNSYDRALLLDKAEQKLQLWGCDQQVGCFVLSFRVKCERCVILDVACLQEALNLLERKRFDDRLHIVGPQNDNYTKCNDDDTILGS